MILQRQQKKEKKKAMKWQNATQKEQLITSESEDEKINPEQECQQPEKEPNPGRNGGKAKEETLPNPEDQQEN